MYSCIIQLYYSTLYRLAVKETGLITGFDGSRQPVEFTMEDPPGEDDRLCRICHGNADGGAEGRLFRPCLCAGTMAWVHVECLDKWRHVSSNSESFFRCDQCQHKYEFGRAFTAFGYGFGDRFTAARLLGHGCAVPIRAAMLIQGVLGSPKQDPLAQGTPSRTPWILSI